MEQQTEIFPPKYIAMELKKKGFNELCVGWYYVNQGGDSVSPNISCERNDWLTEENSCTAPTYDQVVGWFASKGVEIDICGDSKMTEYSTDVWIKGEIVNNGAWMPQSQQSLLTAFDEALKLIKHAHIRTAM